MPRKCFFSLEQFKAYKQAMIKHSQAQDDYKVLSSFGVTFHLSLSRKDNHYFS